MRSPKTTQYSDTWEFGLFLVTLRGVLYKRLQRPYLLHTLIKHSSVFVKVYYLVFYIEHAVIGALSSFPVDIFRQIKHASYQVCGCRRRVSATSADFGALFSPICVAEVCL